MDLLGELRGSGWYLNELGLKKVTPPPPKSNDVNEIIKLCLDTDFREIADGALVEKKGPIVLQIQSIRNISAPKISERSHGPRLLCIELSDGQATIKALELQKISLLDLNTPPGTKIRFRAEQLQILGGYILLKQSEVQVLGGNVAHLVEKWEVARTMQMYARSGRRPSGAMGPPPWIAFGKSLHEVSENLGLGKERNFKSLQIATEKDKDNKENEEFNAMRNEALKVAEAAKAGTKKIFGGGGQQILDHNIKKILDKGYSEEEARQFLRATNNNLERALYNLKRRHEANKQYTDGGPKTSNTATRAPNTNRDGAPKRGGASKAEETTATKPAANVSLFDFLTDKLPTNAQRPSTDVKTVNKNIAQSTNENKTNNNSITSQAPREQQQRNQQQYERQADGKGGRHSEPRQQSNRPIKNEDSRRNDRGERNSSGIGLNTTYNKQNGRIGGGNVGNRNTYDNNDDNNRRSARNERGAVNSNRKPSISNNNYQQNSEINTQAPRNSEVRHRSDGRPNSNRNQQKSQQQHQRQYNSNNSAPNAAQNQTYNNNQRSRQTTPKQPNVNLNVAVNMNPPTNHSTSYSNSAANQMPAVSTTTLLPNGFVYDPSKIIGFQSKEANEYAMNLLRSQGKTLAVDPNQTKTLPPPQQQPTQQPAVVVPPPQPPIQYLPQPGPVPMATMAAPMHIPVSAAMPLSHHYTMTGSMPPPTNEAWSWKVGDLCMAKYWDDGQYYEAEITGISDKTCVVFFIGYGNHEEVLKADCLPITDAHHRPINNYNLQQQMQPPQMQQQHQRAPMRYYVPPHKRNN